MSDLKALQQKLAGAEASRAALKAEKDAQEAAIILALAPKGWLQEPVSGQFIEVWSTYERATIMEGRLVAIIEAGETPRPMPEHFHIQTWATALKKVPHPTRPSKYRRYIVQRRPGRCFVYPDNPKAYLFYPGSSKERS